MALTKKLSDREYLFTLLMAIVRKEGDELRISEETLIRVTKEQSLALMYDRATKEIILKVNNTGDLSEDVKIKFDATTEDDPDEPTSVFSMTKKNRKDN